MQKTIPRSVKIAIKVSLICIVVIGYFLLSYKEEVNKQKTQTKPKVNSMPIDLPEVSLLDWPSNETINFMNADKFGDGPHFISLFATWCGPCRQQHQFIKSLKAAYPELSMVGVNVRDENSNLDKFFHNTGNPYDKVYKDPENKLINYFGNRMVPQSLLIYRNEVVFYHKGRIDEQTFRFKLRPIIDTLSSDNNK